jgi:hypothetical protein
MLAGAITAATQLRNAGMLTQTEAVQVGYALQHANTALGKAQAVLFTAESGAAEIREAQAQIRAAVDILSNLAVILRGAAEQAGAAPPLRALEVQ